MTCRARDKVQHPGFAHKHPSQTCAPSLKHGAALDDLSQNHSNKQKQEDEHSPWGEKLHNPGNANADGVLRDAGDIVLPGAMAARHRRPLVEDKRIQDEGCQEGGILEGARSNMANQECPGAQDCSQCVRVVRHARSQHHHKSCELQASFRWQNQQGVRMKGCEVKLRHFSQKPFLPLHHDPGLQQAFTKDAFLHDCVIRSLLDEHQIGQEQQ